MSKSKKASLYRGVYSYVSRVIQLVAPASWITATNNDPAVFGVFAELGGKLPIANGCEKGYKDLFGEKCVVSAMVTVGNRSFTTLKQLRGSKEAKAYAKKLVADVTGETATGQDPRAVAMAKVAPGETRSIKPTDTAMVAMYQKAVNEGVLASVSKHAMLERMKRIWSEKESIADFYQIWG